MKKLLFTFVLFIQTALLFSQAKSKATLSLSTGAAVSTGNFAKTDLFSASSGFAKPGEVLSISYTKPVSKKTSFVVQLSGQRNPLNTNAFERVFSTTRIYQGFYYSSGLNNPPPQASSNIYPNCKFDKKSWLYAALQVGGNRQFYADKNNNLQLTANATLGALYAAAPELKGSSFTDTASAIITQTKSKGFGVIYSVGCGMNYQLTKKVFLTSTLNYTGTNNITFKNVKSTLTTTKGVAGSPNFTFQQSTITGNSKQTVSSVNVLIGLGISL